MEVQFKPDLQAKLDQLSRETGRSAEDLILDALAGYLGDLPETRQTLDSRYDDIKSGKVKLIPGEEVETYFREKTARAIESRKAS